MIPTHFRPVPFLAVLCFLPSLPVSAGGSAQYQFTGGSMSPTLNAVPTGVTVSNFSIGLGLGSMFDNGGGPDSLRLSANDGISSSSSTAFTNNAYFSFSITIAAGFSVSLESLSMDSKATLASTYLSTRTFSTIRGHSDLVAGTIGTLGRRTTGSDDAVVTSVLNLVTPRSNATVGGLIQNGDFTNLTGPMTLTFEMPFITGTTAATTFIDIDNITLNFVESGPPPGIPLKITGFQRLPDQNARISMSGNPGDAFSVMASESLATPLYRKRWSVIAGGMFDENVAVRLDENAGLFPRRFYVVANVAEQPKARIMPLGDSITEGGGGFFVYRGPLYDKLAAAGYHFDFAGSHSTTYNSAANGTVTLAHEGQGGANAQTVAANLAASFPTHPADIVLIHSGHNYNTAEAELDDEGKSAIATTVENATRNMISTCRATNPKVIILLGQVVTSNKLPKYSYIPSVNERLASLAAEMNTTGSPVTIVNHADGWNPSTDTVGDLVHPNAQGAEKMAVKWFNTLAPLLE